MEPILPDEPDIFCPDCGKQTARFDGLTRIDFGYSETRVCRGCHNTVHITRYESDPAFKARLERYTKSAAAILGKPPKLAPAR